MGFCRFGVDEEERDFWPCVLFLFLFFLGGGWGSGIGIGFC